MKQCVVQIQGFFQRLLIGIVLTCKIAMPKVHFQQATVNDLNAIASVHLASWHHTYQGLLPPSTLKRKSLSTFQREWKKTLHSDSCQTILAHSNESILGACSIGFCGDPDLLNAPSSKEVYSIFVDPHHMRKGIGRGLLSAHLEQVPIVNLYAWVVVGNRVGEMFYESMQFAKEEDTEKDFIFKATVLRVIRYHRTQIN